MEYICQNPDCPKYGKKEYLYHEIFKYQNGELVGEHAICSSCGKIRKKISEGENIPLSEKNISIGRFASSSPEQKREMLKKRSHEDYEKHIKERKDGLLNQAISEMRNIAEKK